MALMPVKLLGKNLANQLRVNAFHRGGINLQPRQGVQGIAQRDIHLRLGPLARASGLAGVGFNKSKRAE